MSELLPIAGLPSRFRSSDSGMLVGIRGFSLIEVLIALVIMVIALLGLISLTINSVRFSDEADLNSSAVSLAYDIADRMRTVNADARGNYVTAFADQPTANVDCHDGVCLASDLATWDIVQWKRALSTLLPSGQGEITQSTVAGQATATVIVRWSVRGTNTQYQLQAAF